ncbi:hypothetical protein [Glutamicibacter sp. NPDC087673]|uniref:hypothetical protein n=1 Tax=Glutamicibacter sp. NPDC087673 TaxID=3363997 RepID=UPI003802CA04
MGQKIKRFGFGIGATLVAAFAITSCGSGDEPITLSDDERTTIIDVVQEQGTVIDSPTCQVEVFRIEDSTTYGWATCAPDSQDSADTAAQADAFPFRIDGQELRRPDDGSKYEEGVKELFPEDLRSAITQHSTGAGG